MVTNWHDVDENLNDLSDGLEQSPIDWHAATISTEDL